MVSRSIKPETSGLSVVAFCYRVARHFRPPSPMKICKAKPSEARMSFRNLMTGVLAIPSDENERE